MFGVKDNICYQMRIFSVDSKKYTSFVYIHENAFYIMNRVICASKWTDSLVMCSVGCLISFMWFSINLVANIYESCTLNTHYY